jgi:hypothetical protein
MFTKRVMTSLAALCVSCVTQFAWADDDAVLSPNAKPFGYSLTSMASATALFDTSGNNLTYYPVTPFQVLYADFNKSYFVNVTCRDGSAGFAQYGGNVFVAKYGTPFYVPLFTVDDSPPVLGTFPTGSGTAAQYFFGSSGYGGHEFSLTVDGESTSIGPGYVAGPVSSTSPLLDGGGSHLIALGAFVRALAPGTHTVTVRGEVASAALLSTYGFGCDREDFTYVVKVLSKAESQ